MNKEICEKNNYEAFHYDCEVCVDNETCKYAKKFSGWWFIAGLGLVLFTMVGVLLLLWQIITLIIG